MVKGEIKTVKELKRKLIVEGYSTRATQEICKWYEQ
jgi:hypothetical protein